MAKSAVAPEAALETLRDPEDKSLPEVTALAIVSVPRKGIAALKIVVQGTKVLEASVIDIGNAQAAERAFKIAAQREFFGG